MKKVKRQGVLRMLKVREILGLCEEGLNQSEIAVAIQASRAAVQDYLRRAEAREISYSESKELTDEALLLRLGKSKPGRKEKRATVEPNFALLERELEKKGVTLALLWQEWSRDHACPDYSYSTFCRRLNRWARCSKVTLRQLHHPGEKLFVDYAGVKVGITDPDTLERREVPIFVAVLGASYYKYAEATESAELPCWLGSHVRCFEFFGGVTKTIVIDNLRTGVSTACRYDPVLNRSYQEFAEHYGVAVLPARSRKPRDKAKVEKAVQDIERWVLAPLRDRRFTSVAEVNEAMKPLLASLNDRMLRDYGESPKSRFERFEHATLQPLPANPYAFATWKTAKVNLDYHVATGKRYYSVPYQLVGQEVWIRQNEKTIEIFHNNVRVALHVKGGFGPHSHITDRSHMPPNHAAVTNRTADYFRRWSKTVGPETARQVEGILLSRPREEFGYRTIQGIKRLAETKGATALENACALANERKTLGYRALARILAVNVEPEPIATPSREHSNIRGPKYFH